MSHKVLNVLAVLVCLITAPSVWADDLSGCDKEELDFLQGQLKKGYWTYEEIATHCRPDASSSDKIERNCDGILGRYDFKNWVGTLRLSQEGAKVGGSYGKNGVNSVTGTLTGNVLQGNYTNSEAGREGTFELTFSLQRDGSRTVTGTWRQTSPSVSTGTWGHGTQRCP